MVDGLLSPFSNAQYQLQDYAAYSGYTWNSLLIPLIPLTALKTIVKR
jgi:hypothetical protein